MVNKNKEAFSDSEPNPEVVQIFYNLLKENGRTGTSDDNKSLFAALDTVCKDVHLPIGVGIGKYWSGDCIRPWPNVDDPATEIISAFFLGEVVDPVPEETEKGRTSTPVGMIELKSRPNNRLIEEDDYSYFAFYKDGSVKLEPMPEQYDYSTLHGRLLDDVAAGLPAKLETDGLATKPYFLTNEEKFSLLRKLDSSMNSK